MDTQTLPMKLTRAITEAETRDYERDGVIWLREIIDPEWAQEVARAAERVAADPPRSFVDFTNLGLAADAPSADSGSRGGELWTAPDLDWAAPKHLAGKVLLEEVAELAPDARGHYLSIANCWTLDPFFQELALRSPIVEIAAVLMRTDRINLYEDQLLIKPPMTLEKTAWHHDLSYDNIEGMKMCGIRIPSHAETQEMGAVRYWKGSHREDTIYKVNFFISNVSAADDPGLEYPDFDSHSDEYDIVYYEPQPGDVIVHHLGTVHGAGGNLTEHRTRCAITLRYAGDDIVYKYRSAAPPQERSKLSDGDLLDDEPERFPRVWPR